MILQKNNTHVWIWEIHASFLFFYNGHVHDLGVFWLLSLVKSQDSYFFKKKTFYVFECFPECMCVCQVGASCLQRQTRGKKCVSDALGLELQEVMICHMGAGS